MGYFTEGSTKNQFVAFDKSRNKMLIMKEDSRIINFY